MKKLFRGRMSKLLLLQGKEENFLEDSILVPLVIFTAEKLSSQRLVTYQLTFSLNFWKEQQSHQWLQLMVFVLAED